jgi:DNA-binding response OmpR family regulator
MAKILLVEDDSDLTVIIEDALTLQKHMVEVASTGPDGRERLLFYEYDLVILDWELPGGLSGVDICKEYRSRGGLTPVIMLTGKDAVREKEAGLDAGADDYLTKPFEMRELQARLRALLRRPTGYADNDLTVGDFLLQPSVFRLTRKGEEIRLLPKEFALLEFFMRHKGQSFSAEAILNRVWPSDSDATPESFRTCLKRLRQKVDIDGQPSLIEHVHGLGYRINPTS